MVSLQRPVEQNKTATVKEFRYDMLFDLPDGIGDRFSNSVNFSEDDVESVLDAISEKLQLAKSPEENVIFDVYLKGKWPFWLAGIMSANMIMWDDVWGLKLILLDGSSWRMFPREYKRV